MNGKLRLLIHLTSLQYNQENNYKTYNFLITFYIICDATKNSASIFPGAACYMSKSHMRLANHNLTISDALYIFWLLLLASNTVLTM